MEELYRIHISRSVFLEKKQWCVSFVYLSVASIASFLLVQILSESCSWLKRFSSVFTSVRRRNGIPILKKFFSVYIFHVGWIVFVKDLKVLQWMYIICLFGQAVRSFINIIPTWPDIQRKTIVPPGLYANGKRIR